MEPLLSPNSASSLIFNEIRKKITAFFSSTDIFFTGEARNGSFKLPAGQTKPTFTDICGHDSNTNNATQITRYEYQKKLS